MEKPQSTPRTVRLVFRYYVGPTAVDEIAERIEQSRAQGRTALRVLVTGTEHLHVLTSPELDAAALREGPGRRPNWEHSHGLTEIRNVVRDLRLPLVRSGNLEFLRFVGAYDCSECGNPVGPGPVPGQSGASGYGEDEHGKTCYPCSSRLGAIDLARLGMGSLYLTADPKGSASGYKVSDWPGGWEAPALCVTQGRIGGCVDGPRRSFRFIGPDGEPWSGVCAGDMDLARVKRLKPGGRVAREVAAHTTSASAPTWILTADGTCTQCARPTYRGRLGILRQTCSSACYHLSSPVAR